jgi:MFS family permease
MHLDEVLVSLGEKGYYPYGVYIFLTYTVIARAWHILAMSFLGYTPPFHCALNETESEYFPVESKEACYAGLGSTCTMNLNCYALDAENKTVPCPAPITFSNYSGLPRSISEEWNYVCDGANVYWFFRYTDLGKTFYVLGALFGYLLVMPWADKIGRKPVTLGCTWIMGLTGLLALWAPRVEIFYAIRFVGGLCYAGTGIVWTWVCEIFSQKTRTTPVVLLDVAYTVGVMTLPGLSLLIPSWRYLYMAISIGSLLTIPLWWLCPESVKWLYSAGKEERGRKILEDMAKYKNKTIPTDIHTALTDDDGVETDPLVEGSENKVATAPTVRRKWTYPVITVTVLMAFIRAVCSMYYYGLSFSTNTFGGNKHLNFFLFGAIEVPAIFLVVLTLKKTTRRFNVFFFLSMSGVALASLAVLRSSVDDMEKRSTVRLTLNLVGKFAITAAYAAIDTYGSEVFPTEVRGTCNGIIGAASRLSSLASTFAEEFFDRYPIVPEAVFGFAALGAALMMLANPETKGRPVPQHAADLNVLRAHTKYCFFGGDTKKANPKAETKC